VLHYAVMRGTPEILQYLLGKGVDVNSRTRNGTTPAAHRSALQPL
jgi:ankyrin repeat protein